MANDQFPYRGGASMPPSDLVSSRGRIPPQAIEMEQDVLGGLLLGSGRLEDIEGFLKEEMFYKESHRYIYKAILDLTAACEPVDILTVKSHLSKVGKLDIAGGIPYLTELSFNVASTSNNEYHARVILEKYQLRELIKLGDAMVQAGYENSTDVAELISETKTALDSLENPLDSQTGMDFAEAVYAAEKDLESIDQGQVIFFPPLPYMKGYSFAAGEVCTVAADSGIGKTSVGMEWAMNIAKCGFPVLFNSLEMEPKQLAQREMAMAAGVDGFRMRQGGLSVEHWQSWEHLKKTKQLKIVRCWTPRALMAAAVSYRKKLGLPKDAPVGIVNDYLQLMTGPGSGEEKLGTISGDLKQGALDNNLFLINLAQLNKEWLKYTEKEPTVHNIRGSDKIRHDSDFVFLLHRPETVQSTQTNSDGTPLAGLGMVIIGKSRIGILGNVFKLEVAVRKGKWMTFEAANLRGLAAEPDGMPNYVLQKQKQQQEEDENELYNFKL